MMKISFVSWVLCFISFSSYRASCFSTTRLFENGISSIKDVANRRTTFSLNVGTKIQLQQEEVIHFGQQDRSKFISNALISGMVFTFGLTSEMERANAADDSLKGSKKDPAFESCLSKCMYTCTKPKGDEQKSRSECLPECKKSCATTKAQLLKGVPAPIK